MLEKRFSSNDRLVKSLLIDLTKFDYAMELQDETQIDFDNSYDRRRLPPERYRRDVASIAT